MFYIGRTKPVWKLYYCADTRLPWPVPCVETRVGLGVWRCDGIFVFNFENSEQICEFLYLSILIVQCILNKRIALCWTLQWAFMNELWLISSKSTCQLRIVQNGQAFFRHQHVQCCVSLPIGKLVKAGHRHSTLPLKSHKYNDSSIDCIVGYISL